MQEMGCSGEDLKRLREAFDNLMSEADISYPD